MNRTDEDATISSPPPLLDATQVPLETNLNARHSAEVEDAKAERRLKDAVRRYYALAELIETERGYVDDLKILVEVYLASLGAIIVPAPRPRAESVPISTPDIAESSGFGSVRSSSHRFGSDASSSRLQSHAYQYPPSSFPSSATMFKENVELKPKTRARPASLQMLSALQPQTIRLRKDSGPEPHFMKSSRKGGQDVDRSGTCVTHACGQGNEFSASSRTRSIGFGLGSSPAGTAAGVRRASLDVVRTQTKPVYDQTITSSPESSPYLSPSISPCTLPSIPSTPLSSHPSSPLLGPSQLSQRHQRLRASLTDAERHILARDAQEMLALHERIVHRIEHALGSAQREVVARRRAMKGKGKAGHGQTEVECEVEAAVRAVCSVYISEASNFTPYEAFCAGHTEALETARRMMRAHANDWVEWEKLCAEAAVRRDVDGAGGADARIDSPLPSPSTLNPIEPSGSRNSLLSNPALDVEDANSSSSTLRRRHSACVSTGTLRTSGSGSLKHTKSDPTPPTAGHSHTHGLVFGNTYSSLSVKSLAGADERVHSAQTSNGIQNDNERQRERSGRTKLSFSDYLIKPVQRLCKYPLLFEQLRTPRKTGETDRVSPPAPDPDETPKKRKKHAAFRLGGDSDEEADESDFVSLDAYGNTTDVAIERVLKKMREVAHAVDEAQRRRDLEKKSSLIVDRLVAGAPRPSHDPRPIPTTMDDDKDHPEGSGLESHSELGHGIGTVSPSASTVWSNKPPARSLSFSSAFSRSRSRNSLGRTNSAFILYQQQQQQASEFGETRRCMQVPGPPTRAFLMSLGACLLAGSFDIVVTNIENWPSKSLNREDSRRDSILSLGGMSALRSNNGLATASTYMSQPSREPVRVKYLAAFLYVGGYIVLAKTPKAGVYEPRHWFTLSDETIEIVDVREEKSLLPCSFHLVFRATGHRLEFAAACQREKEIWLNAMRHARSLPPMWEFEPVPTLNISANLVNAHASRNSVEVPPVPSMPVPSDDPLAQDLNPSRMPSNATLRTDSTVKPNRRQSVNGSSVLAFFSNNSDNWHSAPSTVLIRRVSATRRAQTDRYLADVLSQPLLSARFQAKAHDEVLFRDPDPPQQGTGIGVGAMAKNKLMGRESVLISKQCAPSICSSLASSVDQRSMISESASSITVQQENQHSTRGKDTKKSQRSSSLSMLLTFPGAISDASMLDSRTSTPSSQSAFSPNSPLPCASTTNSIDPFSSSQCSSASTSAPTPSPVNELFPPEVRVVGVDSLTRAEGEELPEVLESMDRPKRSRSLVGNFRGFFGTPRSLSSSPAPSMSSSRQTSAEESLEVPDAESTPQKNVFSRILRSTSFRPRGRSASNIINSAQTFSSSSQAASTQVMTVRSSFIARSSSMLAIPRRKPDSTARTSARPRVTCPPAQTPDPAARLSTRSSRSSLKSEARSQMSLGRSIKYRLFPGNLVPLTPIDSPRDRMS